MAATVLEVPSFTHSRVGFVDDWNHAQRFEKGLKLRQAYARRREMDVHRAPGLVQTAARGRAEGLLPAFQIIGVRRLLHFVAAEQIASTQVGELRRKLREGGCKVLGCPGHSRRQWLVVVDRRQSYGNQRREHCRRLFTSHQSRGKAERSRLGTSLSAFL